MDSLLLTEGEVAGVARMLSTPCNGFSATGYEASATEVSHFQLHVMDSHTGARALRCSGEGRLSTPCNGFRSVWPTQTSR